MNHGTLRRKDYDPRHIPDDLRVEAEKEHLDLQEQFNLYQQGDHSFRTIKWLSIKLGRLLYTIRSNIKHGEKTPKGPDLAKVKRDMQVCQSANPLLNLILDLVFDSASERLAIYGTLAPNEPNEVILKDMKGEWIDGKVRGNLSQVGGLPIFEWNTSADEITVKVFCSDDLPSHLARIDSFEGNDYERILVPITLEDNTFTIANIYNAAFAQQ